MILDLFSYVSFKIEEPISASVTCSSFKGCGRCNKWKVFLISGRVAWESNFRFVENKSDLKSASDCKFVWKATVTWEQSLWTKHHAMLWLQRDFLQSHLYLSFTCKKPQQNGPQNMLPITILVINFFFSFLVFQQHANINLLLCFLLFMQNLHAQNILLWDSSTCSQIVVRDPWRLRDNTRGPLSKAFTNKQRKLWFVAQCNSQRTCGLRRWPVISLII